MLVLASSSPRRKQLLSLGGWDFKMLPARVDERLLPGEPPDVYVHRLAVNKAQAALRLLDLTEIPGTLIIGADTAVVDIIKDAENGSGREEILGKPVDAREAEKMLRQLRGHSHRVCTALVVLGSENGRLLGDICVTNVPMRDYSDEEIKAYIATGDPLDKAGAYAIQHAGFKPVEKLQGCYANVMGLPLCHLTRLLAEFGFYPRLDIARACQEAQDYPCPVFRQVLGEDLPFWENG
jgi:septum formation protein